LRFAVNTRLLLKNKLEGIGWFTYETMKRICQENPEHEFYFIFDRKFDKEFIFSKNITPVVVHPQARHPILHYIWYEYSIPFILRKIKPDLFISPDAYCSLSTNTKTLLVIHDLNFEHYPEHMPWLNRKYYRYFTPKFAQKADRIATVSNYSKNDIIKQYGIDPSKIDVIYNGTNTAYRQFSETEKTAVKAGVSDGNDYFVFIGALNPRKNLVNLFKAFDIFKKETNSSNKLVVVGEKMYWSGNIKTTFEEMEYQSEVVFTGRLNIDELTKIVSSALGLTYVSLFEGFGIPIIEAFKAGTPVITSNVTSMPEVAGDAALLIDPENPDNIAEAMKKIASDNKLRDQLIEKGFKRAESFSWDITAEKLWKTILHTVK